MEKLWRTGHFLPQICDKKAVCGGKGMGSNMAEVYNHREVETKWQKIWDDERAFQTSEDYSKPKYYALVEFPYPSGQGLHVGHPRPYTALDIVARKRRMQGYNVLYPMGWDAFGLPTENYAIKNHIHPKIVTQNNVARFKSQLHSLGYSFDCSKRDLPTSPRCRSTGVLPARSDLPTRKW